MLWAHAVIYRNDHHFSLETQASAQDVMRVQIAEGPPAAMALGRLDVPPVPQPGHQAAEDDRIRAHRVRERLGGHGAGLLRQVQQHVERLGQSSVSNHVTHDVA